MSTAKVNKTTTPYNTEPNIIISIHGSQVWGKNSWHKIIQHITFFKKFHLEPHAKAKFPHQRSSGYLNRKSNRVSHRGNFNKNCSIKREWLIQQLWKYRHYFANIAEGANTGTLCVMNYDIFFILFDFFHC